MSNSSYPGLPENLYQYENEFNYDLWDKDTIITLCNVPWDFSYRDVVKFADNAARNSWFDNLATEQTRITTKFYLKYGYPVTINTPFNTANKYNYLRVQSPLMPVPGEQANARREYYYFITSMQSDAPNATKLTVQLDVWTTYINDVQFGECYIERGHYAVKNTPTVDEFLGHPTNTQGLLVPEGMDIGSDYVMTRSRHQSFQSETNPLYVVFSCTADLTSDFGTLAAPKLTTSKGGLADDVPSGAGVYACPGATYTELMSALSGFPWVSQCIQTLSAMPKDMIPLGQPVTVSGVTIFRVNAYKLDRTGTYDFTIDPAYFKIPSRYAQLTKLYTYPYCAVLLTDDAGQNILFKPEGLRTSRKDGKWQLSFAKLTTCTPPYSTMAVFMSGYNGVGDDGSTWDAKLLGRSDELPTLSCTLLPGDFLDNALIFTNYPTFSVVNNSYLAFMAQNVNSRAYQYAAADWSNQKAMAAANLSYDQSQSAIATGLQSTRAGVETSQQINAINNNAMLANAATNAIGGLAVGGMAGGPIGAIGGLGLAAANSAISYGQSNAVNAANNALALRQAGLSAGQAGYVADTNKGYADYANRGDYENAIKSINAKIQDAKLLSPSTSGAAGGDALLMGNGYYGMTLRFKRIRDDFLAIVGDHFLRFGYAWQRYGQIDNLNVCTRFSYWKLLQTYFRKFDAPEEYRQAIKGILEKGVTVWTNPDYIGKTKLEDNEVIR